MKSCKKGYYYCNTDKKCKPIPEGSVLRDDGFLMKETLDQKDKPFVKKLVKKLRGGSKTHAKQADDLEKAMNEEKHGDHEPEMIRNQLKTAGRASKRIEKHSRKKDNFKAWVQSKITKASDYLDTAADYLDSKEVDEAANPAQQAAIAIDMKKKGKKPKNMTEEGLRAWFGKSSGTTKSGRKVKGWVQVGGKYDGKPCARQPGQKTTPKCVSSAKRRSMSDKAAPTMVSTDPKRKMKEEYTSLSLRLEVPKTQSDFTKGLMFRESLETNSGMLFVFDRIAQQSFHMTETTIPLEVAFIRKDGIVESIKSLEPRDPNPVYSDGPIELAIEVNRGWFAENNVEVGDELVVEYIVENPKEKYRSETGTIYDIINEVKDKKGKGSGTKDACYHKVKSRYSVWPSAYASGALVKCRKVGAANWGNKSEALEIQNADGQTIAGVVDIIGQEHMKPITNDNGVWKGTQQVTEGMKRDEYGDPIGGPKISKKQKTKNLTSNTPDEQHTTTTSEGSAYGMFKGSGKPSGQMAAFGKQEKKPNPYGKRAKLKMIIKSIAEKERSKAGVTKEEAENIDEKCWKGYEKKGMKTMFGKRYPNCVKKKVGESVSNWRDEIGYEGKDDLKKLSEDDMKGMSVKSGHKRPTKSGAGMTKKGVEAYRRRNPGSKLQTAVTTKPSKLKKGSKAANRRKSYCARSAGQMKKFPKAAKDPNSRLRQARRRWNC